MGSVHSVHVTSASFNSLLLLRINGIEWECKTSGFLHTSICFLVRLSGHQIVFCTVHMYTPVISIATVQCTIHRKSEYVQCVRSYYFFFLFSFCMAIPPPSRIYTTKFLSICINTHSKDSKTRDLSTIRVRDPFSFQLRIG